MTTETRDLPMQHRAAEYRVGDNAGDQRLIELVWSTGAGVERYDFISGERYIEELSLEPGHVRLDRLNRGAPLLNSHQSYDVDNVLGSVVDGSARIENGQGIGTVKFSDRENVTPVWNDVQNKIIRNLSIGYHVYQYEVTKDPGGPAKWRAIDWEPFEVSIVAVPADAGAQFRNAAKLTPCRFITRAGAALNTKENNMTTENVPAQPNAGTETPATVQAAPAVEQERSLSIASVKEIRGLVEAASLPAEFALDLAERKLTVDQARAAIIDEMAKQRNGFPVQNLRMEVGDGNAVAKREAMENALTHRANPTKYKLDDNAREFRGLSLLDLADECLSARGVNPRMMSKDERVRAALGFRDGGYHGTTDFPIILANVTGKVLRDAYGAAPQTFKEWTRQVSASDFKPMSRVQLGEAPALEKVGPSGEFKSGTIGEASESYKIETYGKIIPINRQTIINDDLSAFNRIPELFARAAANLESDTIYNIITSNPAMGDTLALFHANHKNLAGSNGAIAIATLAAARQAMRTQTGIDGKTRLNLSPTYLLVPAAQETVAQQFVAQTNIVAAKASDYNPFAGTLKVIAEPRLDANSTTAWYLITDPSQIDTIEYAYLSGNEGLQISTELGFEVDGLKIKAQLDFGAKAIDWRGFYKNPGA